MPVSCWAWKGETLNESPSEKEGKWGLHEASR